MRELLRLFWVIIDQAIFAIGNFVINILFARWLFATQYGLFSVSFSGYLLLMVVHWGVVLEPLLVLSAHIPAVQRRAYIKALLYLHIGLILLSGVLASLAMLLAMALGAPDTGYAIMGAGFGGIFLMTLWAARRLCLVFLSASVSAAVGLLYTLGAISTAYALHAHHDIVWYEMWIVMAGWSLLCSTVLFGLLLLHTTGDQAYPIQQIFHFQRRYAPGATIASVCAWLSFEGVLLLLSRMGGLVAVAETRAISNLVNPLTHVNLAMNASWLVSFSEHRATGRRTKIWHLIMGYGGALSVVIVGLAVTAPVLVKLAYGGRYLDGAWQLPLFGAMVACNGLAVMFTCALKTRGDIWHGFAPAIANAVVALCSSVGLISRYTQAGAVYAILLGSVTALLLGAAAYGWVTQRDRLRSDEILRRPA